MCIACSIEIVSLKPGSEWVSGLLPRADERLTIAFASLPPWDPRADGYSGRSVAAQGCQGVKGAMGFQASLCGTLKGP